jgi:hypothetical protein
MVLQSLVMVTLEIAVHSCRGSWTAFSPVVVVQEQRTYNQHGFCPKIVDSSDCIVIDDKASGG